jgi:hypothetical protein
MDFFRTIYSEFLIPPHPKFENVICPGRSRHFSPES